MFTIGIVVIAVIVAISVSIIADNNKINLANTYIVKVEGIDTQGTASCQINKKALKQFLLKEILTHLKPILYLHLWSAVLIRQIT